jgi:hypothetical protein
MTRATTMLLLLALVAACGGIRDDADGMLMDDEPDMMVDSTQVNGSMDSRMIDDDAMGGPTDDAMSDGTPMSRDTSETRRP